jgi:hypothetical protein
MGLSKIEKQFLAKQKAENQLFIKYKKYLGDVKQVYLKQGVFAAQVYIKNNANDVIELAVDDLIAETMSNLSNLNRN